MTPAVFVAEAASWQGTPFRWQGSTKGEGADCKGYVAGVARALGLPEANSLAALRIDYDSADLATLRKGLALTLQPVKVLQPADVLLLKIRAGLGHLAIFAGDSVWHVYEGREVMASTTAGVFRTWPLDSAWRFRSLQGRG